MKHATTVLLSGITAIWAPLPADDGPTVNEEALLQQCHKHVREAELGVDELRAPPALDDPSHPMRPLQIAVNEPVKPLSP